jgi:hypothetical protein
MFDITFVRETNFFINDYSLIRKLRSENDRKEQKGTFLEKCSS